MGTHRNIAEMIRIQISSGHYQPGQFLPSISVFSNHFHCSPKTIRLALELLEENQWIAPIAGNRYVVRTASQQLLPEIQIDFTASAPLMSGNIEADLIQWAKDHSNEFGDLSLLGASITGNSTLICAIGRFLNKFGMMAASDSIVLIPGSQQALSLLCSMPFPNEKSAVLIEQPTFRGVFKWLNEKKHPVLGIHRDSNGIDFNQLERLFHTESIRFFYMTPRNHNPIGRGYTKAEKLEILRLAQKYNVYIVEDEILSEADFLSSHETMFSLDSNGRVIYLTGYAKTMLPGYKIGTILLPNHLKPAFVQEKDRLNMEVSPLAQGVMEMYLRSGLYEQHLNDLYWQYHHRMEGLRRFVERFFSEQFTWTIPEAGYFASVKMGEDYDFEAVRTQLQSHGIRIPSPDRFFMDELHPRNHLYISVGKTDMKSIELGIPQIASALRKQMKQPR